MDFHLLFTFLFLVLRYSLNPSTQGLRRLAFLLVAEDALNFIVDEGQKIDHDGNKLFSLCFYFPSLSVAEDIFAFAL